MEWVEADWPVPPWVRGLTTTRQGGVSRGPFASLNLASHVGDDAVCVAHNRSLLARHLDLPEEPHWLAQVHGCGVAEIGRETKQRSADAAITAQSGRVCAVLTADCLPVLLCDREGSRVGAVHAGWKGLAAGVIETAVARLGAPAQSLVCWLGPAIGPDRFEVGDEVRARFVDQDGAAATAFRPSANGRWLADLYRLAKLRLDALGVEFVGGGGFCTHADQARFFSYRRDGATGRMASLIWIDKR